MGAAGGQQDHAPRVHRIKLNFFPPMGEMLRGQPKSLFPLGEPWRRTKKEDALEGHPLCRFLLFSRKGILGTTRPGHL